MLKPRALVLITMILIAAALRIAPHPPNFTPVAAMALFGGAYFASRSLGFIVPLAAMVLSDLVIGMNGGRWLIYSAMALTVCIGWLLRTDRSPLRIVAASLASSVAFFIITNFAVWAGGTMYPKTMEGLAACFIAALPFFQNSVIGDLFFAGVLFGGFALAERWAPILREPEPANAR